ncbi:MAG: hypothetical protein GEU75_13125 [Dehalococcoidia bacterium]|nr:hypothetical protein [Dehalococcoidia bacterium]
MTCMEAGLREDAAFAELARAVAHRQRIDAKLAIYDDHWEGYEAALQDMEAAVQAYWLALEAVREARGRHYAKP